MKGTIIYSIAIALSIFTSLTVSGQTWLTERDKSLSYASDELVVIFEEGTTQAEIESIAADYGMYVADGPTLYTQAYLLKFDEGGQGGGAYSFGNTDIDGTKSSMKGVAKTGSVGYNFLAKPQPNSGIEYANYPAGSLCYDATVQTNGNGGNAIHTAIFDTGISLENNTQFPFLDYFDNSNYDFVEADATTSGSTDDNGHGTHIASLIVNDLPNSNANIEMTSFKTHDLNGQGDLFDVIQAIDQSIADGVDIVNMSFSFLAVKAHENEVDAPLRAAIEKAGEIGNILFVVAAGNDGIASFNKLRPFPASYPSDNILSVGSVDCNGQASEFTNWNDLHIDIAAPGENIWGANENGMFEELDGTSQATAFVSKVATYLGTYQSSFDYALTKCAILNGATPMTESGLSSSNGILNTDEALNALLSGDPCNYESATSNKKETMELSQLDGQNQFNFYSTQIQEATVVLYDLSGRVLMQDKIQLWEGNNSYQLNYQLPTSVGMYLLNLHTNDEVQTLKIVR